MFKFDPAPFVPYKNKEVLERCRNIKPEDMEKSPEGSKMKIHIVDSVGEIWIGDMVARIVRSDLLDEKLTMILPNPCPVDYSSVAEAINRLGVNCRNVHIFTMDEWADQDGNIAPLDYKAGFAHSCFEYFVNRIDEKLRMPISNFNHPTTANIKDYSKLITECGEGGADICYSGPGWTGHLAFIDPDTPEFGTDSLEDFINMDARVVTLNPMTILQNSLHGTFGCSGDIANVPPKAATIGPADAKRAKNRFEMHAITHGGSYATFQRMISRLVLYGEVTPQVPSSILQLWDTDAYVSKLIAAPFGCDELVGY
ncbi:MAG: hypothetical protein E7623_06215 [Ruminococcaceae bacterium]|nr:hypothetical protein [Oscillospiraceae bacterium]